MDGTPKQHYQLQQKKQAVNRYKKLYAEATIKIDKEMISRENKITWMLKLWKILSSMILYRWSIFWCRLYLNKFGERNLVNFIRSENHPFTL